MAQLGLAYLGLAWLGLRPQAGSCKALNISMHKPKFTCPFILISTQATFSCDGASAHPREYSIRYTDHNLSISSSIQYLGSAQGMSSINIGLFGYLRHIKTCKVFELATRTRIVWVAALHRVCLDNTLFLPSFPIPDMTARSNRMCVLHGSQSRQQKLSCYSSRYGQVWSKPKLLYVVWATRTYPHTMWKSTTPAVNHRKSILPQSTHIPLFV